MPDTRKSLFKDFLTLGFLIVVIVIPVRMFIISPFVVEGESMHPAFENLDYLVVNEFIYVFKDVLRGDVIVFRYPDNPSLFYIKRVIGLPGETVSIDHGMVTIIKQDGGSLQLDEPYVVNDDATYSKDVVLGSDDYFVMGDNRPNSSDSRNWGRLPRANIIGRADVRLLPISEISFFPGSVTYAPAFASSSAQTTL